MNDDYVTKADLERAINLISDRLGDKINEVMTQQTDRLLKALSFYEKMTEKHENNFKDIKKSIK